MVWYYRTIWVYCIVLWFDAFFILHCNGEPQGENDSKSQKPTFAGKYAFVGTVDMRSSQGVENLCIVTAVTENWVLTVYSCFSRLLPSGEELTVTTLNMGAIQVSIPNFNLSTTDIGEQHVGVNKVVTGEKFGEDNLVLIRLTKPISKELVGKVKVANQQELDPKCTCVTLGWKPLYYKGVKNSGVVEDNTLQDIPEKVTTANPGNPNYINGTILGQTLPKDKVPPTVCKFEYGSPLLCEKDSTWNLVGVTGNLGDGVAEGECRSPSKYSVFISVEPFVNWIFSNIRETEKSKS